MPSIANQDYKIYGLVPGGGRIPAPQCAELYAAILRAKENSKLIPSLLDSMIIVGEAGDFLQRIGYVDLHNGGIGFYDYPNEEYVGVMPHFDVPAYYDALWAIQLAEDNIGIDNPSCLGFSLMGDNEDMFAENTTAAMPFMSEDGYIIKGTKSEGKLSSLYLGERVDDPTDYIPIHFESLLPLVGKLPLETTEIW